MGQKNKKHIISAADIAGDFIGAKDAYILVTGKDWKTGKKASRAQAAAWLVVGFTPAGKAAKAAKIAGKTAARAGKASRLGRRVTRSKRGKSALGRGMKRSKKLKNKAKNVLSVLKVQRVKKRSRGPTTFWY